MDAFNLIIGMLFIPGGIIAFFHGRIKNTGKFTELAIILFLAGVLNIIVAYLN